MALSNKDLLIKINEIRNGTREDSFTPTEFVRYLLINNPDPEKEDAKKRISRAAFSAKFSRPHYFVELCHDETPGKRLPDNFADALASLTGRGRPFWKATEYNTMDAAGIFIDMQKEVAPVVPETQVDTGNLLHEGSGAKVASGRGKLTKAEETFLTFLPQTAKLLLIDQETGQWQRGTFLIDFEGNPTRHYRNAQSLFEGKTPGQAIADIFTRDTTDPLFAHKGHFMRRVVAEAKKQNASLAINVDRTQSAIQVQPHDKGKRFL